MRKIFALIFSAIIALSPTIISAAPYIDINVYVTPGSGVTSFSAVYINDTQVNLSWSYSPPATGVLIRAKYGLQPSSTTDGYLVYEGSDSSFSDTTMNFDENAGMIFYRIWGYTTPGNYTENSLTDETEGITMQLLGLIILVLGLTLGGFIKRNMALIFGAAASWMILSAYAYTKSTATWDVYYALFFVSAFMVLACIAEAVIARPRKEDAIEDVTISDVDSEYRRQWSQTNLKPIGLKKRVTVRSLRPNIK